MMIEAILLVKKIPVAGNRFETTAVIPSKPKIMKQKLSTPLQFLMFTAIAFALFTGCTKDKCSTTYTYQVYEPVYLDYDELRQSVASEAPHSLDNPGKIYVFGSYLFVNELNEGVHVIDNRDPASPINKAFIKIPGNVDIAVKGPILFADSYVDLVAIDISNPENATESKRLENLFPQRIWDLGYYYGDPERGVVVSWELTDKTETVEVQCGEVAQTYYYYDYYGGFEGDLVGLPAVLSSNFSGNTTLTTTPGQGGSMARFTIASNFLYCIDNNDMNLVDISDARNPAIWNKLNIGFNIETIFPYGDKLFIGSSSGMFIYDNSNPSSPVQISQYSHITSCDPVVVEGNYAYVTLRNGTRCQGFTNELQIIDISNLSSPSLVKTYSMYNPHGLGIDNGILFICDGDAGLKVYDATDINTIDKNLLKHYGSVQAYDVIPLSSRNILIMIGLNGLYQYDYTNLEDIQLISEIPVI